MTGSGQPEAERASGPIWCSLSNCCAVTGLEARLNNHRTAKVSLAGRYIWTNDPGDWPCPCSLVHRGEKKGR
jgi:hypothetical protein